MKKLKLLVIVATLICAITALCVTTNAATYSGECGANGDNLTWTLDTATGVLEIDGTGEMKDWTYSSSAPWYSYYSSIKTVTLGIDTLARAQYLNAEEPMLVALGIDTLAREEQP